MSDQVTDTIEMEPEVVANWGTPELVVDMVYVLPEKPGTAHPVTLGAQVRNNGTLESGPFKVGFVLDGTAVYLKTWDSLGPGQSHWDEQEMQPLSAGQHMLVAVADGDNEIHETNKDDNLNYLQFHVEQNNYTVVNEEPEVITPDITPPHDKTSVYEQIEKHVNDLASEVGRMWQNYGLALNAFGENMHFASAQEAEFNADAVLKGGAKGLMDVGIGLLEEIPAVGPAIKMVKGGVEAYFEESERSKKAWDQVEIKKYISELYLKIDAPRDKMIREVNDQREPMKREFDRVVGDVVTKPDGSLSDKAREFIINLEHHVREFDRNKPTAAQFEAQIAARFASALASDASGKVEGRLAFHIHLYRIPGGWAPKQIDPAWKVETSRPEPARIAEALKQGLKLSGKKPWQADLPKKVILSLASERGDDPWATGEFDFTTDPAGAVVKSVETKNALDRAQTQLQEAWSKPSIRGYALDTDDIEG
jgi:CARDB